MTFAPPWDTGGKVWWAQREDVPGLVADADTLEVLIQDLRQIVADLLYLNRDPMGEAVPFRGPPTAKSTPR